MMRNNKNEAVILIHGLWMKGFELFYLQLKLWLQGYRVYLFRYQSVFKTPEQNSGKLFKFISKVNEPVIHFVAHSLGGIVVIHLFGNHKIEKDGKVVMIASPVNGCAAASYMAKNKYLKYLLGKSIIKGLLGDVPKWKYKLKTCVIVGIKSFGIGRLLTKRAMQTQNDGTVNVHEAQLEYADESHVISRSHFTLLFSNEVAIKILAFLQK